MSGSAIDYTDILHLRQAVRKVEERYAKKKGITKAVATTLAQKRSLAPSDLTRPATDKPQHVTIEIIAFEDYFR